MSDTLEGAGRIRTRDWILFGGGVAVALILIAFGAMLLFMDSNVIDSRIFYLAAAGLITGGILFVMPAPEKRWAPALAVVALGAYFLARATGTIQTPWLALIIGLLCWLAAIIVLYMAHPASTARGREK